MKTTWHIIKSETVKKGNKEDIQYLDIKGKITFNQQIIADSLNGYFITIVDNIYDSSRVSKTGQPTHDICLNYMIKTSKIRCRHTSTSEIEEIIKFLKARYSYK
jgi:hypothetical protein